MIEPMDVGTPLRVAERASVSANAVVAITLPALSVASRKPDVKRAPDGSVFVNGLPESVIARCADTTSTHCFNTISY